MLKSIYKRDFIYRISALAIAVVFTASCSSAVHKLRLSPFHAEIDMLLKKLKSAEKKEKLDIIKRLGEIGQRSERAKRELMRQFTNKDEHIRSSALSALQLLVKKEALEVYIADTKDNEPEKRIRALNAFRYYDDNLYERYKLYRFFIDALKDPDVNVRMEAVEGIYVKREKRAVKGIAALLLTEQTSRKKTVSRAIIHIGRPAVPFLIKKLYDPLWQEASPYITKILLHIEGPVADGILSIYKKLSRDVKLEIMSEIKYSLEKDDIGRKLSKEGLSLFFYLNEMLKDETDPAVSIELLKLLMDSYKDPLAVYDVINPLFKILSDIRQNENVQYFAIRTLAALHTSVTLPAIKKSLLSANREGKLNLIRAIGLMSLPDFIPVLSKIVDEEEEFKAAALESLQRFHSPYAASIFLKLLKENDARWNKLCIDGLVGIGGKAADRVADLLDDSRVEVRRNAAGILKFIAAKKDVPRLIDALMDDDEQVRRIAAFTIGKLNAEEAVPDLIAVMLMDSSILQFNQAAKALQMIGPPAVPHLLDLLKVDDAKSRVYAAWVLANIGSPKAVEPIRELADKITKSGIPVLVKSIEPNSYALVKVDAVTESLRIILNKTKNK